MPGRPAASLPALMSSLHGLCGGAHRLCATACLRMACDGRPPQQAFDVEELAALETETLGEHLRRVLLDWPRAFADPRWTARWESEWQATLARCGAAMRGGTLVPATATALAAEILGQAPETWLAAWNDDPQGWLDRWAAGPGWLPALLSANAAAATLRFAPTPVLRLDSLLSGGPVRGGADAGERDAALATLARSLLESPACGPRTPHWLGGCAETGVWARHRQPQDLVLATPWLRLGARLAELARLASPDRPAWLVSGGVSLAADGVLAWVEMARGVLMHAIRLDGSGRGARLGACAVLAPTEWNFHPFGALARALAASPLPLSIAARRAFDLAVVALDPCVAHRFDDATTERSAAGALRHA